MQKENQKYETPRFEGEIKLALNRNESVSTFSNVSDVMGAMGHKEVSRYPSLDALQEVIGNWVGVDAERIVVTSGGDEGIDRVIRDSLKAAERQSVVTHSPSFEMFDIYTHNAGGRIKKIDWPNGEFPTSDFIGQIDEVTALAVVVSPNNPTGLTIDTDQLILIADRCQKVGCRLLVDCAYVEFAKLDPTSELIDHPSILMVRTFSKAWGLAGMRVGYLIAPDATLANELRAVAGPFPVSGTSIRLAHESLVEGQQQMLKNVESIKQNRIQLERLVVECGGKSIPSQGNFVLAEFSDVDLWSALAEQGIAIRKFSTEELKNQFRITVPVGVTEMMHLARAFSAATDSKFDLSQIVGSETLNPTAPLADETRPTSRTAELNRKTKETDISIELDLDGDGSCEISTGIGFLDHMLTALTFHSRMNLKLNCVGDLHIDDHHTAEDCALALGNAISDALGVRKGIKRFGYAYAPLDEGLARTVLDLSGRPWPEIHLDLKREMVGTIATENLTHFFQSLAMTLKCSLHVDVLRGDNDHHKAEAAFKSLALALNMAIQPSGNEVPSTKGVL